MDLLSFYKALFEEKVSFEQCKVIQSHTKSYIIGEELMKIFTNCVKIICSLDFRDQLRDQLILVGGMGF